MGPSKPVKAATERVWAAARARPPAIRWADCSAACDEVDDFRALIKRQREVLTYLRNNIGKSFSAEEIAEKIGAEENAESIFKILEHASANANYGITKSQAATAFGSMYAASGP